MTCLPNKKFEKEKYNGAHCFIVVLFFLLKQSKTLKYENNMKKSTFKTFKTVQEAGVDQWMGIDDSKLQGFSWRGGAERETNGILLWPHPFVIKRPDGTEVWFFSFSFKLKFYFCENHKNVEAKWHQLGQGILIQRKGLVHFVTTYISETVVLSLAQIIFDIVNINIIYLYLWVWKFLYSKNKKRLFSRSLSSWWTRRAHLTASQLSRTVPPFSPFRQWSAVFRLLQKLFYWC